MRRYHSEVACGLQSVKCWTKRGAMVRKLRFVLSMATLAGLWYSYHIRNSVLHKVSAIERASWNECHSKAPPSCNRHPTEVRGFQRFLNGQNMRPDRKSPANLPTNQLAHKRLHERNKESFGKNGLSDEYKSLKTDWEHMNISQRMNKTLGPLRSAYNISDKELISIFFRVDMSPLIETAIDGGPTDFLPDYRNPCWKSIPTKKHECGVKCLPLVFLAGVTKSGTTDLFDKLLCHEDIVEPQIKEPMWWNRLTIGSYPRMSSFDSYIGRFNPAACAIEASSDTLTHYHDKITLDGTPAYFWDYDGWEHIPGNAGLQEPKYILPSTLRVLVPHARIIVILRQPSERTYSNFRMKSHKKSAEYFHNCSVDAVNVFNKCLGEHSLRHCTYNNKLVPNEYEEGLFYRASLYYVYLKDWLDIFPRDQMMIIKAEDYYANRTLELVEAFNFLNLDEPSSDVLRSIEASPASNSRQQHQERSTEPMLPETKTLLDAFYAPYNAKLARLLGDNRFNWT